eukprot:CAMPEP_0185718278 /NCGR_PEP_ID=MMETSP1164-20130828/46436_1 /TAXON_ID=1104430 /ORGANISM="Chrysoreinhardia sp, Strain CCMP2950" /LENGTH=71 /DNA_ID=CAMNT_0028385919 /DNA_START=166 /DNA_END=377 /DNA_ORIENTATION=+
MRTRSVAEKSPSRVLAVRPRVSAVEDRRDLPGRDVQEDDAHAEVIAAGDGRRRHVANAARRLDDVIALSFG